MEDIHMHIILSAMDQELSLILDHAKIEEKIYWNDFTFYRAELFDKKVILGKSGVGKVLSAMVVQHLIDTYAPKTIIFTGLAGALNSELKIGDLLIGKEFIQHDFDARGLGFKRGEIPYTDYHLLKADAAMLATAESFECENHQVMSGRILSGDQFIHSALRQSHQHLVEELNGDAVEMEGASVALVCQINKIPYIVSRTISDLADDNAVINFNEFLPVASKNSLDFVKYILYQL